MKKILTLLAALFGLVQLSAQDDFDAYKRQLQQEYNQYSKQQKDNFEAYRNKLNAEYAEYMRQAWQVFSPSPAKPMPKRPEPPTPVVKDPKADKGEDATLPVKGVVPAVTPTKPAPAVPIPNVPLPPEGHTFTYYGTSCKVPLTPSLRYTLRGTSEANVADAWETLSKEAYLPVLRACDNYRKQLNLCDWGYVRFVQKMTESFFSTSQANEAVLMQMYLLVQSGYKARIARSENTLFLLLPFEQSVYGYSYIKIDGESFYIIAQKGSGRSYAVLNHSFPKERRVSLYMNGLPYLSLKAAPQRSLTSKTKVSAAVVPNQNMIAFFNDYPAHQQWGVFTKSSLSKSTKDKLYPVLKQAISGKSKTEAANILINFVQTAFNYKTDDEQFGVERALFADETIYYPYSDCEDRSILYSVLVRELLGLDVVLLQYPGHLATAVRFGDAVEGDYIIVNGKKYIVCDPTYIGADIGEAMPKFKNAPVTVVSI